MNVIGCPQSCSCVPDLRPGHDDWDLYVEGDDLYDAMMDAIGSARQSICMESFIFAGDEIGQRIAGALAEKAAAGCSVRLLIDAVGSFSRDSLFLMRGLRAAGAEARWFHRWSWRHPLRYNQRNHRKLLVVDDSFAFLGGFNIHRENSRRVYGEERWRDTHLRIHGHLAVDLARQFDAVWCRNTAFVDAAAATEHAVVVSNFFRNCHRRFRCLYADLVHMARKTVCLTTPYFVPDPRTQKAMVDAAKRGVMVRLLVPYKSDVPIVHWAARALYAERMNLAATKPCPELASTGCSVGWGLPHHDSWAGRTGGASPTLLCFSCATCAMPRKLRRRSDGVAHEPRGCRS